jgi:spore maturation protein CgeB
MNKTFDFVFLGLTVTSSWGNGHATTYRSLIRGLVARGHRVLFLERDAPWYAENRDQPQVPGAATEIYHEYQDLVQRFESQVRNAALTVVGSYVPEGVRIGQWVNSIAKGKTAFYDIDTPVTLSKLEAGDEEYISKSLIGRYDAYFSFTAGPALQTIERDYGSPMARALYCSVDPEHYRPMSIPARWDLGYLGTYSADRQPALNELLVEPARRWTSGRLAVIGPQYPKHIQWPPNVTRTIHLSPREHRAFYAAQRFTLNITREAMKRTGYSPSVRLFEAGACSTPIISDWWEGLDSILRINEEVLIAEDAESILRILHELPDDRRSVIARAARRRILAEHTAEKRAIQLESYLKEMNDDVSAGAAWRDRCRRAHFVGPAARYSSEPARQESSGTPCTETVQAAD